MEQRPPGQDNAVLAALVDEPYYNDAIGHQSLLLFGRLSTPPPVKEWMTLLTSFG